MNNTESNPDERSKIAYFDQVREQLRYWPYTIHQIDDTLDISLIEGRGKQLLFRAVNSKNLVAFAGSGLSMSYGRLGWKDWSEEQQRVVRRNAESFCETAHNALLWGNLVRLSLHPEPLEATEPFEEFLRSELKTLDLARSFDAHDSDLSANEVIEALTKDLVEEITEIRTAVSGLDYEYRHNAWQWTRSRLRAIEYASRQIGRLLETFDLTSDGTGTFPGGEELPVKFEIAQQLNDQLNSHIHLFLPPTNKPGFSSEFKSLWHTAWSGAFQSKDSAPPSEALSKIYSTVCDQKAPYLVSTNTPKCHRLHYRYQDSFGQFEGFMSRQEAFLNFETLAKNLVFDECPDALLYLRKGLLLNANIDGPACDPKKRDQVLDLERRLKVLKDPDLKRDIDGIREKPERYRVLTPFKISSFRTMQRAVFGDNKQTDKREFRRNGPAIWVNFHTTVEQRLKKYVEQRKTAGDKRIYLTPSSRFLVALYLSLAKDPFDLIASRSSKLNGRFDPKNLDHFEFFQLPSKEDFTSRRSIIADRFDPLAKVVMDLGVKRFITTNYDFEIERFFQDRGYRNFPPSEADGRDYRHDSAGSDPDKFRSNAVGGVLHDQAFSRERAAELTSFMLETSAHDAGVYHLHGRATKTEPLVITERDYMKLYMTQDKMRDTVDEGINLAFSSSPLLFIGLGMSETDLLRPLRQFISNRDRTIGYTSVALLPAEKNLDARTKFSAALFLRYGVHTVFYGSGFILDREETTNRLGIDWLCRILSLITALKDEIYRWDKLESGNPRSPKDIAEALFEAVGTIGKDLADDDIAYHSYTPALNVLFGSKSLSKTDGSPIYDIINAQKLAQDPCGVELDPDLRLKNCFFSPTRPRKGFEDNPHFDPSTFIDGDKYLGFYTSLLDQLLKMILVGSEAFVQYSVCGREERLILSRLKRAEDKVKKQRASAGNKDETNGDSPSRSEVPRESDSNKETGDQRTTPEELELESLKIELKKLTKTKLAPLEIALDGLRGALITASLNAALEGISKEQKSWWRKWQQSPQYRKAYFQRLEAQPAVIPEGCEKTRAEAEAEREYEPGTVYIRHCVDNVITDMSHAVVPIKHGKLLFEDSKKQNRLAHNQTTGIRAFDTFIVALQNNFHRADQKPNVGNRRLVTVAAHRGLGKGTFITAFSTKLGLSLYTSAAWPKKRNSANVEFFGHIFINLSFSPEIASVYDMLSSALIDMIASLRRRDHGGSNSEIVYKRELTESISGASRIEGIKRLFLHLAEASKKAKTRKLAPRILICLGGVELLYDKTGHAKNGEIYRFIKLLFSGELRHCPVDLIFVGDEAGIGKPWSAEESENNQPKRVALNRTNLSLPAIERIKYRLDTGAINLDAKVDTPNHASLDCHYVHVARPVSPVTLLVDNFQTLALALYIFSPPKQLRADNDGGESSALTLLQDAFSKYVVRARAVSDAKMDMLWRKSRPPEKADLKMARDIARRLPSDTSELAQTDPLSGASDVSFEELFNNLQDCFFNHINSTELAQDGSISKGPFEPHLHNRLKKSNRDDAAEWRVIRRRMGGSRFALTILLTAAEHMVIHASNPAIAAEEAVYFIRSTVEAVGNLGQERRDQMVLEAVLNRFQRYHVIGDPDLDADFHQLILRHLGVIGTPVASAVLVRLPEFRKYFARIGIELDVSRRRFLVRALTVLSYRGLIFRLDPHPRLVVLDTGQDEWGAEKEFRYALHRIVQGYALLKLNGGTSDPIVLNSFAPTIYAAMPSNSPNLSRENYRFLRSLMIGLSQYPDVPQDEAGIEPWLFTTDDRSVRVQALRAALTLARSTFSVAVISRLSEQQPISEGVQKRGHLETYRVRLRWIIRMAWELRDKSRDSESNKPDLEFNQINALYRDEIVWLYNELGVLSLVQGNLSDAIGFLRQASEFNENIEGHARSGPIYNHIDLNHAVVQIERAQLGSARLRLNRVLGETKEQAWKLHHVAKGYECLLNHLEGNTQNLDDDYLKVTDFFQQENEIRAAAIFLNHRGRFLTKINYDAGKRCILEARDLAETGGHEDVRHTIELTRLKLLVFENGVKPFEPSAIQKLIEIEDFGRRMGIWSLQADALRIRADALLTLGETTSAGRLLIRSMAIAKRHSMGLRLNNAMTIYAKTLFTRGDLSGASRIARASLDRAKRTGYSLELPRAQDVLNQILNLDA